MNRRGGVHRPLGSGAPDAQEEGVGEAGGTRGVSPRGAYGTQGRRWGPGVSAVEAWHNPSDVCGRPGRDSALVQQDLKIAGKIEIPVETKV